MTSQEIATQSSSQSPSPQPFYTAPAQLPPLPNELWLDIFSRVLQSKPFLPSPQCGVLILSWVCNQWRTLIISEARFWTTIHLFNNRMEMGKRQRQAKLVDLCLQRSNSCELDVTLTDLQRNHRPRTELTLPLSFLSQADRWRSLRLEVTMGTTTLERFSILKGHLKRLKSCTLIYKFKLPKRGLFTGISLLLGISPILLDFLENAPQLQTLVIPPGLHTLSAKVPFSKLTQVNLVPDTKLPLYLSTIDNLLNILKRCPNLSHYRFAYNFPHDDGERWRSRSAVSHPNLFDLQIFVPYSKKPRGGHTIFKFLDLPSLTALSITSYERWGDNIHDGLDFF